MKKLSLLIPVAYLIVAYLMIESPFYTPKYKTGECISSYFEATEFEPAHTSVYIDRIKAVGKTDYLLYNKKVNLLHGVYIKFIDRSTVRVNCDTGERE